MSEHYGNITLTSQFLDLMPYLDDPDISEIAFNRPCEFWVLRRDGWEKICNEAYSAKQLELMASTLSTFDGKKPSTSIMSRKGPRGERFQIVQPPACRSDMFVMSIRKHITNSFTMDDLCEQGVFNNVGGSGIKRDMSKEDSALLEIYKKSDWPTFIKMAVSMKKNILISGATGSGKTTFFRAIADEIELTERLITIEEVNELFLERHQNKVHLEFGKGERSFTSQDMLEACMRLSPNRILLGELRGDEAWDYLQSLNTGHPGSISTIHANSAWDAFTRLSMLIKQSSVGQSMSYEWILNSVLTNIHVGIFIRNRRVAEIFFDPEGVMNRVINQN